MLGLVVNPNAGGKLAKSYFAAKDFLAEHNMEHTLISAESPEDCLVQLNELKPDKIIALGGDGTLHSLTQFAVENSTPIVLIPAGSGNDSARKLGISSKPAREILSTGLIEQSFEQIDLMKVSVAGGVHYSTGTISAGLDSLVNQRTNNYRFGGFLKYPFGLLRELPSFSAIDYKLTVDGEQRSFRGMLCSVSNSGIFGGGMKIVPQANLSDSSIELFTVRDLPRTELLQVFPRVYRGTHLSHPAVSVEGIRKISLSAEVPIYADGEPLGFGGFDAEVMPKALTIAI
mgnify:FL=1